MWTTFMAYIAAITVFFSSLFAFLSRMAVWRITVTPIKIYNTVITKGRWTR